MSRQARLYTFFSQHCYQGVDHGADFTHFHNFFISQDLIFWVVGQYSSLRAVICSSEYSCNGQKQIKGETEIWVTDIHRFGQWLLQLSSLIFPLLSVASFECINKFLQFSEISDLGTNTGSSVLSSCSFSQSSFFP